jgi:hypothetical protein
MLQFFLLSCMLGYCFQLCATNDSLVSRFHRPLSDCPTNLKAMMWHLFFFFPHHLLYQMLQFFLISFIWVSSPCQNCPMYKSDDVAPSFFLSTTSTVPILWFFLLSCMLGHCFQLCVIINSTEYPGFIALCQTALQTWKRWCGTFSLSFYNNHLTKCFISFFCYLVC